MLKLFLHFVIQVVFPKSDEQRQGLAESVKKILLFRSLDKVSQ